MSTVTFSFKAEVPDNLDPRELTVLDLLVLINEREVLPLVDLPNVEAA